MSSTLCAASSTVSAQEKRKCHGAKPKPPTKSDLLQTDANGRTKNSHVHTFASKTKTQSWSSIQVNLQFLKTKQQKTQSPENSRQTTLRNRTDTILLQGGQGAGNTHFFQKKLILAKQKVLWGFLKKFNNVNNYWVSLNAFPY